MAVTIGYVCVIFSSYKMVVGTCTYTNVYNLVIFDIVSSKRRGGKVPRR